MMEFCRRSEFCLSKVKTEIEVGIAGAIAEIVGMARGTNICPLFLPVRYDGAPQRSAFYQAKKRNDRGP
jgi:hypothetical protein